MTQKPSRRLGQYYSSGDWSDYWRTAVSYVGPHELLIRGYPIEDVVAKLTYTETLYLTVRGELPTDDQTRVFDAVLSSIPAHQFVSSHQLAAAVTASASPASPVPGIAAGILCIGSNTISPEDGGELVQEGLRLVDAGATEAQAATQLVQSRLDSGRQVPGLGHPNHKDFDPRAEALADIARAHGVFGRGCEFYEDVRDALATLRGRRLPINIDGMIAGVLSDLGFTPPQMVGVAAVAIMPGLIASVDEEIADGVPLRVVPDALGSKYVGPARRSIAADQPDANPNASSGGSAE